MTNTQEQINEFKLHIATTLRNIGFIKKEFLQVLDPSEAPEVMEYCRNVAEAFDEVVLAIGRRQDNEELREMMRKANDAMLQSLIDYHNPDKEVQ